MVDILLPQKTQLVARVRPIYVSGFNRDIELEDGEEIVSITPSDGGSQWPESTWFVAYAVSYRSQEVTPKQGEA